MTTVEEQKLVDDTAVAFRVLSTLLEQSALIGLRFEVDYQISHIESGTSKRAGIISKIDLKTIKQVKVFNETTTV